VGNRFALDLGALGFLGGSAGAALPFLCSAVGTHVEKATGWTA
jgi:hypothetical protein